MERLILRGFGEGGRDAVDGGFDGRMTSYLYGSLVNVHCSARVFIRDRSLLVSRSQKVSVSRAEAGRGRHRLKCCVVRGPRFFLFLSLSLARLDSHGRFQLNKNKSPVRLIVSKHFFKKRRAEREKID